MTQHESDGYSDCADETAAFDAEIAIAKARLNGLDWSYLIGKRIEDASDETVSRACMVTAYAMMEIMVQGGKTDPTWHAFLHESLDEVIYKAAGSPHGV